MTIFYHLHIPYTFAAMETFFCEKFTKESFYPGSRQSHDITTNFIINYYFFLLLLIYTMQTKNKIYYNICGYGSL